MAGGGGSAGGGRNPRRAPRWRVPSRWGKEGKRNRVREEETGEDASDILTEDGGTWLRARAASREPVENLSVGRTRAGPFLEYMGF